MNGVPIPLNIPFIKTSGSLEAHWGNEEWKKSPVLELTHYHSCLPELSPKVQCRLGWNNEGLCWIFSVHNEEVVTRFTGDQEPVWQDSCVELFFEPQPQVFRANNIRSGYFNVELNAAGALRCSYITDSRRRGNGFASWTLLSMAECSLIKRTTSVDKRSWTAEVLFPWTLVWKYTADAIQSNNRTIKIGDGIKFNAYKCVEDRSVRGHWISLFPIGEALNFHVPEYFMEAVFQNLLLNK